MPNHCQNTLTVKGNAKELQRFRTAITENLKEGQAFNILENLYPTPEALTGVKVTNRTDTAESALRIASENYLKYGAKDWYDWNCKYWGSKWSEWETYIDTENATELRLGFTTVWSPIGNGIREVSAQFPELQFTYSYSESGIGFCGAYAIQNGEFVADLQEEYPNMSDCWDEAGDDYNYELENDRMNTVMEQLCDTVELEFSLQHS